MRVASHLGSTSGLADAKDLIRAGVDGFAHTVRDRDIDEEFMALVREHPDVWTIPNLPGSPVTLDDLPWLRETLPPFEIENLRAAGPSGWRRKAPESSSRCSAATWPATARRG